MYKEHMEYTTCEKAIAGLLDVMGPVHGVDWGCYFSETKNGWFRPECEISSHPLREASETAKNLWKTPGGVFLILFIIGMSLFLIWWAFYAAVVSLGVASSILNWRVAGLYAGPKTGGTHGRSLSYK